MTTFDMKDSDIYLSKNLRTFLINDMWVLSGSRRRIGWRREDRGRLMLLALTQKHVIYAYALNETPEIRD